MPPRIEAISAIDARRIGLTAQGLGNRATKPATAAAVLGVVQRLGVVQIDSVNVLARAHYMPAFSRIGAYDRKRLDDLAYAPPREIFEYWGHEASYLPVGMQPLFRFRMERAARFEGIWAESRRSFVGDARSSKRFTARSFRADHFRPERFSERGTKKKKSSWWNRSDTKRAAEWLFWAGRLTTTTRRHFERVYDVPERVLPEAILAATTPSTADAHRELLRITSRALGIGTEDDLRDYFRLKAVDVRPRLAELLEEGALTAVQVEGWKKTAYLDAKAKARAVDARALLSPFDPVVWFRPRAERLFHFHYRIEIYTPAHRREHGYYVLPFLLGDRIVARVDLKAARTTSTLEVRAAHVEDHADPRVIVSPLAAELRLCASWLGLEHVKVFRKGRLASVLATATDS